MFFMEKKHSSYLTVGRSYNLLSLSIKRQLMDVLLNTKKSIKTKWFGWLKNTCSCLFVILQTIKFIWLQNVWIVIEYDFYEQVINKIQCVINAYRKHCKLKI